MKHRLAASALCLASVLVIGASDAIAQEPVALRRAIVDAARQIPASQAMAMDVAPAPRVERSSTRPSLVMQSLYATTILMQGLDAHSTFRAIDAGARQTNPLVAPLAGYRPAFIAFKGVVAVALIHKARDLSRRHKWVSVLTLTGINSASAVLIAQNYHVAGRMQGR